MSDNKGFSRYNKTTRYNQFRGYYTDIAASDIKKKAREDNSDTLIRQDVYFTIIRSLREGKNKVEILAELMNKYPDFPGNIHFAQQIEDQIKKREKRRIKTEELDER